MPGTVASPRRGRRLVLGVAFAAAAAGAAGCQGSSGDPAPTTAPSSPPTASPAAAGLAEPKTAAEFWTRLRASGTVLQKPPAAGSVAGERAWGNACRDFQALAAAVKADHETFQIETGARLTVMQIGATCPKPDPTSRRAVAVKIPELLEGDPFATS